MKKWLVLLLIWLMMLVAYCDRVNLTVAAPKIMAALHLGKPEFGYVLSAFTLGYALMQAPGGFLADRFGPKRVLVAALVIWSLFTVLTGMAAALGTMLVIRVLFGVGEGIENGAQFKLIADYFNPKERSQANGLFLTALALGPALATPLAAKLIDTVGWREMFFVFGGLGLAVAILLGFLLPKESGAVPVDQRQNSPGEGFFKRSSLFFGSPAILLCALGYMLFNLSYWGLVGWTPTYLAEDRHVLSLETRGYLLSAVYFGGFLGLALFGWLGSSALAERRAWLVAGCYVAAAVALGVALTSQTTPACIVGLSLTAFFLYGSFGPIWAVAVDLAPSASRGLVTGWVNFCGQVGGFVGQITVGFLAGGMKSFSGAIVFMIAALLLGGVVMTYQGARFATEPQLKA